MVILQKTMCFRALKNGAGSLRPGKDDSNVETDSHKSGTL